MKQDLEQFFDRLERCLERLERVLPSAPVGPNWDNSVAYRWLGRDRAEPLRAVAQPSGLRLEDIRCIDRQKTLIDRNTRQFLHGLPANNVLLWGSRGTGKSSLIKALLQEHVNLGLRLIEVDRQHLVELPEILEILEERPEKFILYCDDLSFESNDASYKNLKATLEGSLSGLRQNTLIYATSNRRHLLPEYHSENQEVRHFAGSHFETEIHHGDSVEEKISLSERFGLWLSFHPFTQDEYLEIVQYWLAKLEASPAEAEWEVVRVHALRFALERGSRSGRVAWQFARDWVGASLLRQADAGPRN